MALNPSDKEREDPANEVFDEEKEVIRKARKSLEKQELLGKYCEQLNEMTKKESLNIRDVPSSASRDPTMEAQSFGHQMENTGANDLMQATLLMVPVLSGILPSLFFMMSVVMTVPDHFKTGDHMGKNVRHMTHAENEMSQKILCNFGLSLACPCLFMTVLVRYEQIADTMNKTNCVAFVVGCFMVGFQFLIAIPPDQMSDMLYIPCTILYAVSHIAYCSMQTYISHVYFSHDGKGVVFLRLVLVVLMALGAFLFYGFMFPPPFNFYVGGWYLSKAGQCIFCASRATYFISFLPDFQLYLLYLVPNMTFKAGKGQEIVGCAGPFKSQLSVEGEKKTQ